MALALKVAARMIEDGELDKRSEALQRLEQ